MRRALHGRVWRACRCYVAHGVCWRATGQRHGLQANQLVKLEREAALRAELVELLAGGVAAGPGLACEGRGAPEHRMAATSEGQASEGAAAALVRTRSQKLAALSEARAAQERHAQEQRGLDAARQQCHAADPETRGAGGEHQILTFECEAFTAVAMSTAQKRKKKRKKKKG